MLPYRAVFTLWITYVAGMTCSGWLLSVFKSYSWMGIISIPVLGFAVFLMVKNWKKCPVSEKNELLGGLRFNPFLVVFGLITLAGCLYTTTVLDSLSYRIPRILLWLQEGGVHFVDNPDSRINYMPPVWEFCNTPLYQAGGFHLLWLGSGISWIILYLVFVYISRRLGAQPSIARWTAMIPSTSVGMLLQASSTMNDIWAMAFIALSLFYIINFEDARKYSSLFLSALSLSLAAGAKPHYAVLGFPWMLWFFLSRSAPFKCIKWKWVMPSLVLIIICSPFITLILNRSYYGSFKGSVGEDTLTFGKWWINLILGSIRMVWQIIQPPINPWARILELNNQSFLAKTGILEIAPRFSLKAREIAFVDCASIGLIGSLLLILGAFVAYRRRYEIPIWTTYSLGAGFMGFFLAVSQVVPGTIGRSFLGFTILAYPWCIAGLIKINPKHLVCLSMINLVCGIASLSISPSHPLIPIRAIMQHNANLANFLTPYISFQERSGAGATLLERVPPDAKQIIVLANGDQNLINLWGVSSRRRKVLFCPRDVTTDQLYNSSSKYIIIAGSINGAYLNVLKEALCDHRFEVIAVEKYQTKNERGLESWVLFQKKDPPAL